MTGSRGSLAIALSRGTLERSPSLFESSSLPLSAMSSTFFKNIYPRARGLAVKRKEKEERAMFMLCESCFRKRRWDVLLLRNRGDFGGSNVRGIGQF